MRLLLTGFEPFLDFKVNPSAEIAKELDGSQIGEYEIFGRVLPVDFLEAAPALSKIIDELNPDVVISLGLAGGRNRITPERIAINCNDGVKDNRGYTPEDEKIAEDGPDGYFSTLPIRKFVRTLQDKGFPAEISNSAGTYLCNNIMYHLLHKMSIEKKHCLAGFVHIPASRELALTSPSLPSWSQRDLTEVVKIMISCL